MIFTNLEIFWIFLQISSRPFHEIQDLRYLKMECIYCCPEFWQHNYITKQWQYLPNHMAYKGDLYAKRQILKYNT
jgi:hypothetical protein